MKKGARKISGILLSLCLIAGSTAFPSLTGNAADADQETVQQPEERKENSFRYQDGQLIDLPQVYAEQYEYAWEKVDGQYRNNLGEVIEGATKKGIDVSHHQGEIDWEKVKADGIDYAILRCGYGGDYTSYDDKYWEYNVSECERLGIPYGVYLYSYSENTADAQSEAEHALRLLEGHQPSYPVYYDLEDSTTGAVDNATLADIAQTFCDMVSEQGYAVGIYASYNWWTTKMTSSVFDNPNWSKWIARYNSYCGYEKEYDMWQCTSSGSVDGIEGNVDLDFWMGDPSGSDSVDVELSDLISVMAHVQQDGWKNPVANGQTAGVIGKRLEAIQIQTGDNYGNLGISYSAFVEGIGWQNPVSDGQTAGTTGQNRAIQAVKIQLTGTEAQNYDIYYRTYVAGYGWLGWAQNGAGAGTVGYEKQMEALQISVVAKGTEAPGSTSDAYREQAVGPGVSYQAHMQQYGWLDTVYNGETSGVTGESKRMEAIKASLVYQDYAGGIQYKAHVQNDGWKNWVSDGEMAGTTGENKRLEAIQMRLTGEMEAHYDLYYRTYVEGYGWLGWAKNGESAGTSGFSKRVEAVQIQMTAKGATAPGSTDGAFVDKNELASVAYQTHMQLYGWQSVVKDGAVSGVTGESKRMEAIKMILTNQNETGSIEYKAHVQNDGWQDWVKDGKLGGTTGESKRMEAIQIRLTGEMAKKYDVYYKVHVQDYGWLDWAKNGETAGTVGMSKRMEAIQIVLVEKGLPAPGSTSRPSVEK